MASMVYSKTLKRNYYYRFTCEYCGKTTDWMTLCVYDGADYDVHVSHSSGGSISESGKAMLHEEAVKALNKTYEEVKSYAKLGNYDAMLTEATGHRNRNVHRPAASKGKLIGKCPFCGKHQSWKTDDEAGTVGGILGAIGLLGFPFLMDKIFPFNWMDLSLWPTLGVLIGGAAVGAAIGFVLGTYFIGSLLKKRRGQNISKAGRNKPEFRWE
jgi:transcription elongation factor Elf1